MLNPKDLMKKASLLELIQNNSAPIMDALEKNLKPIFNINKPEDYEYLFGRYVHLERALLPMQAEKVAAIEKFYENEKSCLVVLDTGYGKTQVLSAIIANVLYNTSYLVVPPHLTVKTDREIRKVIPKGIDYRIVHVESYLDVLPLTKFKYNVVKLEKKYSLLIKKIKMMTSVKEIRALGVELKALKKEINFYRKYIPKDDMKTIYIVAKTLNSLTYGMSPAYKVVKRKKNKEEEIDGETVEIRWLAYDYCCVDCNKLLIKSTVARGPSGDLHEPETESANKAIQKMRKCQHCGGSTIQPTSNKISPAEFLKRYGIKSIIDLLGIDEIHEEKAKDSLRARALGHLIPKSKKVLGLTGTLLGGYASHAFYTFFRMFPSTFVNDMRFEWGDLSKFVDEFGGHERVSKVLEYDYDSLQVVSAGQAFTKERADMSPRLLDAILPMCIFGKLDEIKFPEGHASLPPYTEISHMVEMEDTIQKAYNDYMLEMSSAAEYANKEHNNKKGWARLRVDSLLIPDLPFNEVSVELPTEEGVKTFGYTPPITREELPITNKEKKLLEIIKENYDKGRKVLVYHDFVNSGLRQELLALIANAGYKVADLTVDVAAKKREAYIKNLDCDILITNPELVKTGLDLLEYPTIVYYQQVYSSYNIFTMRQAAKRSWRIGQTEPCEVHSIAYAGSHQKTALGLIGGKMNVSQATEGRLSTGDDIASEAEDENLQVAMARAILSNEQIENTSSTSSKTIDLNAREWTVLEQYYLNKLEAHKQNPSDFDKYKLDKKIEEKASFEKEVNLDSLVNDLIAQYDDENLLNKIATTVAPAIKKTPKVKESVVVSNLKESEIIIPNKTKVVENDLTINGYRIFIPSSRKRTIKGKEKGKTSTVTGEDFEKLLEENKQVQLALF